MSTWKEHSFSKQVSFIYASAVSFGSFCELKLMLNFSLVTDIGDNESELQERIKG